MTGTDAPSRRGFLASLSAATALGVATHTLGAQPTRQAGDPATRARRGLAGGDDFLLEPGLVYLQTGSLGPTPRPVMDRTIAAWRELESNPTFYAYGAHEQQLDVVRQQAATFLGCATDELVLTTCTSEGLNRVAQGLQLAAGDRVLTTDQEHPGGRACWDYLVRTRGVILDIVSITPGEHDSTAIVDRLSAAITPRTKVMAVSHLLSSTGLRMPIAALCARARAHNVISVIDGAQAVGGVAVDVKALGCDVYATSGHKWMLAPKGTGLLYLSTALADRVDPIQLQSGRGAYTASTGVCSLPSVIGLGAAIAYLRGTGIAAIEAHNLALRHRLADALRTVPTLQVVSAHEPALASPLLSYRLPDSIPAGAFQQRLHQRHRVFVKVVPGNWFNGQRISTHLFNTEQDVDSLVTALRAELR